jgi:hypothetical protein
MWAEGRVIRRILNRLGVSARRNPQVFMNIFLTARVR